MTTKRVKLGDQMWKVNSADAASVADTIAAAMSEEKVVRLSLLSGDDTPATVIFNGKVALLATIDEGAVPRPTEISGNANADAAKVDPPTKK
ncbi:hypothetical protein [Actinokineospora globicatena]|uniref:hypothetical protein n=1 Tax=Actinokineospora globicatena TaxID=103729 RepID=UPI0020A315F4|nr:hypothetical protein [Actinokineospora globicatena]MCP2302876.1 hypothetical protein [Actinokineospora globicatena]GLW78741.1 hypothetical protein Aglo01_32230 [Actinokineospora globicatena]GLW84591.1 hypothetical protein Aglo02_22310 [Actinokineospora globicatena]